MLFINGISNDPYFNLAFEEYIFNLAQNGERYFLLWQNDNAVIVGKHQNTIEEINQEYIRDHGIKVVRRMSGGGAVYHDLGNINYTFITEKGDLSNFDFRFFTEPIVTALKKLGVIAEFNSRNDLTIDGKKFSGNAQYIANNRILHHGTLLYDSNLAIMPDILNVNQEKISSKGIKSVKSRVTNISAYLEHKPQVLEFQTLIKQLIFAQNPEMQEVFLTGDDIKKIEQLRNEKYATWEWNYGQSPAYNLRKDKRFEGGTLSIFMMVDKGIITDIKFYGDFFGRGDTCKLENHIKGKNNEFEAIKQSLKNIDVSYYINGLTGDDLAKMIVY